MIAYGFARGLYSVHNGRGGNAVDVVKIEVHWNEQIGTRNIAKLRRFVCAHISDYVHNVTKLIDEQGEDASVLILTAAAALLYEHPSDKSWQEIKDSHTTVGILSEICGLPEGSKLSNAILERYEFLKSYMKNGGTLI